MTTEERAGYAYVSRDKDAQWAGVGEETMLINTSTDGIDNFALERPPHDRAVAHCELGHAAAGENAPLGQIEGIHDCDDVIVARACSLNILDQLRRDQLGHVFAKVGWVQQDTPLEIVKEEHVWARVTVVALW